MMNKAFKENTEITRDTDGTYNIDCKKGLWGVSGAIYPQVMNEAKHYFQQYYSDGEYDGTQLKKLKERFRDRKPDFNRPDMMAPNDKLTPNNDDKL